MHVTTQNLYWITHRESNLLRRPFQCQSITVLGTQTSVSFLQNLPGVAQTSLFASASAPLAPPHLTSAFRRLCQSRGRPARKSRCSRRARVRNSARVASRRCRSRISHHQSHLSRARGHLSFPGEYHAGTRACLVCLLSLLATRTFSVVTASVWRAGVLTQSIC